nr:hypothetical protein CFP56_37080 [Quercus suber]
MAGSCRPFSRALPPILDVVESYGPLASDILLHSRCVVTTRCTRWRSAEDPELVTDGMYSARQSSSAQAGKADETNTSGYFLACFHLVASDMISFLRLDRVRSEDGFAKPVTFVVR